MLTRQQWLIVCVFVVSWFAPVCAGGSGEDISPLSADLILEKMQAANLQREKALQSYTGRRIYEVDYQGIFGNRHAKMVVDTSCGSPTARNFAVISQSGSKLLLKRVLLRLLDSEKEALQDTNRTRTALTPRNYSFRFLGIEQTPKEMLYVLQVIPKVRDKFLYRGKIWIDSQDFAVVQIEGEPAKNPSWWIRSTQIQHHYAKLDGFWLPIHNQSVSLIRLGGKAVLTIDYLDYRIMPAAPVSSAQSGGGH